MGLLARSRVLCLACLWFSICVVSQFNGVSSNITDTVTTTFGPIRGKLESLSTGKQAWKFRGIPFAKAERFENPTDPDKWTATRDAIKFGKRCPQPYYKPGSPLSDLWKSNEECLFINVFVPVQKKENSSQSLAVMVWIHGGAYVFGTSSSSLYDGGILATEEGVIVVTFNYRLGALGFLSTESDSDLKGNYGMLDQVQALKWIKNNIRSFGGDPNEVTLFGVSAGGMSVSLLMLSPLTKGLYKNAILQSGAAPALAATLLYNEPKEHAKQFAYALGCSKLIDLKNCAAKKNISEIITAQIQVNSTLHLAPFAPVVDGNFLEDFPLKILTDGSYQTQGSVMIGVTRDEGTIGVIFLPGIQDAIPGIDKGLNYSEFVKRVNSTTWMRGQNEQILKAIIQEYTNWANISDVKATRQGFMDAKGDAVFKAPAILSAQLYAKKGLRTYFYQMDYSAELDQENRTIPQWRRVPHAADVQYVFGLPLLKYPNDLNNTDVKFSKSVMKYWATFAKTGDPNPPSGQIAAWPAFTLANQQYLSLKPTPETKSNLLAARMNFWNSFLGTLKTEEQKPCPKDLAQELKEKEVTILGLAIVLGLLGLLAIILIIFIIWIKRKSKYLTSA